MAPPVMDDDDDEVKGDMTPMIDIIFLLLIFFILTTKFVPEEKVIASLLPTNKGQSSASTPIEEPQNLNILIYPFGYTRGFQPSEYDAKWKSEGGGQNAILSVNGEQIVVDGLKLSERGDATAGGGEVNEELDKIHAHVTNHMQSIEKGGARKDQDPVVIHCFSGMPWKFALVAYDAIRGYEADAVGKVDLSPEDMENAREVTFAPPRIRDYRNWEMGYELFEIIHMK